MTEQGYFDQTSSDEDEVTFLLRLKPAPTPPVRRKRLEESKTMSQSAPKGWDVVIERQELYSPSLISERGSPLSSPLRTRRYSLDLKRTGVGQPSKGFDTVNENKPPPLPPKYLPSAPPQDLMENLHWYPKPYLPASFYTSPAVITTGFNSSYPNLNCIENPCNSESFYEEQATCTEGGKYAREILS